MEGDQVYSNSRPMVRPKRAPPVPQPTAPPRPENPPPVAISNRQSTHVRIPQPYQPPLPPRTIAVPAQGHHVAFQDGAVEVQMVPPALPPKAAKTSDKVQHKLVLSTSDASISSASSPSFPRLAEGKKTGAHMEIPMTPEETTSTRFAAFCGPTHYHPDPNEINNYWCEDYFKNGTAHDWWRLCGVIFPFFNEEAHELKRSLLSMHRQAKQLLELEMRVHVMIVMDGWWKASNSMKEYIKQMFPANPGEQPWWEVVERLPAGDNTVETYVVQRVVVGAANGHVRLAPCMIGDRGKKIKVSLLIKRDNRRKHNSHQWFFQSFCDAYKCDYAFATDCGTAYDSRCVYSLVKYMDEHTECAGVTGRQRVMSRDMQSCQGEGPLARMYRAVQSFDYEASISAFQGGFALLGMLPVLPGPCGLYRMTDIRGRCLDYYFQTVNHNPDTSGMLKGNLLLAEDRVLSYAASLMTGKFTAWVPHATFFFEAETDTDKFIAQRRRWTNGAYAGYVYLLFQNPGLIWNSKHTFHFKLGVTFLQWLQLMLYTLVTLSPCLFATSFYFGIDLLLKELRGTYHLHYPAHLVDYMFAAYAGLYLLFVLGHMTVKFSGMLYYPALFINAGCIGVVAYEAMRMLIVHIGDFGWSALWSSDLLTFVIVIMMGLPFVLALFNSVKSFLYMCITFPAYFLFLPTFVGWFGAYAFSRTWDLTWGNRPSDRLVSHAGAVSGKSVSESRSSIRCKGVFIGLFLAVLNIGIGFLLTHLKWFVSEKTINYVWLGLALFMISFSVANMLFSFIFYVFYTPVYFLKESWKFVRGTLCCYRKEEKDGTESEAAML